MAPFPTHVVGLAVVFRLLTYRPVSGGGGWGLKQGLLSLDPQTRYSTPDQEDVESFIRSFKGEDSVGGIVAPGSFVQFFVEPAYRLVPGSQTEGATTPEEPESASLVVGTIDNTANPTRDLNEIEVHRNVFGAVSAEGIFISSGVDSQGNQAGATTKIDASNAFVTSSL